MPARTLPACLPASLPLPACRAPRQAGWRGLRSCAPVSASAAVPCLSVRLPRWPPLSLLECHRKGGAACARAGPPASAPPVSQPPRQAVPHAERCAHRPALLSFQGGPLEACQPPPGEPQSFLAASWQQHSRWRGAAGCAGCLRPAANVLHRGGCRALAPGSRRSPGARGGPGEPLCFSTAMRAMRRFISRSAIRPPPALPLAHDDCVSHSRLM